MLAVSVLPARLDFDVWRGDGIDVIITVAAVDDAGVETPVPFVTDSYTGTFIIERPGSDTPLFTWSTGGGEITFPADGQMRLQVADAVLASTDLGKYDLRVKLTPSGGLGKTYFAGTFKLQYK